MRVLSSSSSGKYAGQDNSWIGGAVAPVLLAFDESIMKFPSIKRFPGGASTDMIPNLQDPNNPVPALKDMAPPPPIGAHPG